MKRLRITNVPLGAIIYVDGVLAPVYDDYVGNVTVVASGEFGQYVLLTMVRGNNEASINLFIRWRGEDVFHLNLPDLDRALGWHGTQVVHAPLFVPPIHMPVPAGKRMIQL